MNISLNGIDFATSVGCTLEPISQASGVAVRVSGGDNDVTLRFDQALAKAGGAVTSVSLGIRHTDAGPHSFHVSFGAASIIIGCDGMVAKSNARAKILCDEGPATFTPAFEGSPTYTVTVERAGVVVETLRGRTGPFTIPHFDKKHAALHEETLGVEFTYEKVRKRAWSMTLVHEAHTVTFTAEATQKLSQEAPVLRLKTGGLAGVVLVNPTVKTSASP